MARSAGTDPVCPFRRSSSLAPSSQPIRNARTDLCVAPRCSNFEGSTIGFQLDLHDGVLVCCGDNFDRRAVVFRIPYFSHFQKNLSGDGSGSFGEFAYAIRSDEVSACYRIRNTRLAYFRNPVGMVGSDTAMDSQAMDGKMAQPTPRNHQCTCSADALDQHTRGASDRGCPFHSCKVPLRFPGATMPTLCPK